MASSRDPVNPTESVTYTINDTEIKATTTKGGEGMIRFSTGCCVTKSLNH